MTAILTEAIHLVSSDSAAGHVKQVTKSFGVPGHTRILSDQLTIGPCDVDPERHVEMRRTWNAEVGDEFLKTFGLDDLRVAAAGDLPVIIWATRAYADLVWLWWILDGLGRLGPLTQPTRLVRPEADDPLSTVGGMTLEAGRVALATARAVSDDELREATELSRLYASPEPLAFDEARRRGSSVFPELSESAELHGVWFPRIEGGHLRMAEHDERLLGGLTEQWLMPPDINKRITETRGWQRLLWTFGSYFVPIWRLRAWAAHGAIARELRAPSHDNRLEQEVFRLTAKTRALLADGLESVGDAPPIYVGGCRLNDPVAPWVRIADESGWRIIQPRRT
jgi:Domain of unknown function (DUF1835)